MRRRRTTMGVLLAGIGVALIVTLFSPWASSDPDGLEKVAEDNRFLEQADERPAYEVIPDYQFPGVENERLATVLAGVTGVLAVAALLLGVGMILGREQRAEGDEHEAPDAAQRPMTR